MTRFAVYVMLLAVLGGCGSMPLAQPKTFNDRIGYADGLITAVANSTTASLQAGSISAKEASSVRDVLKQGVSLSDTAKVFGDTPQGQDNLTLAINLLENLQLYLAKRSPQ